MWAWHIHIFADIEPDWSCLLVGQLYHILESKHILAVLKGESLHYIAQLHVFYAHVLIRQNEDVFVRVLPLILVLNEVFTDHRLFDRGRC